MNQTLQKKTEEWMALERKTLEQRHKADLFYEQEMMDNIVSEYIGNNRDKVTEKVKYLIMSVGTSYEPLVLNISLFQPEKILFLYTDISEEVLDKIMDFCNLKMSQVQKRKVNETEPNDIYREIKKSYLEWNRPEKIYIDFTGGTKAMSTAAAMAGAIIKVQMVYVGTNHFMPHFRKPFPGSETLFYIANPVDIFGDLEIEKVYTLFEQYNYAGAREKLYDLKEEVPDPFVRQELNFVYLLAKSYENWDSLDFVKACDSMQQLTREIARDRKNNSKFVLADYYEQLARQKEILKDLSKIPGFVKEKKNFEILDNQQYIIPLMFTMYQDAKVREYQQKYDMATLLWYRLLEMIEQRRLAHYRLFVSRMEYKKMVWKEKQVTEEQLGCLRERVYDTKVKLFGRCHSNMLPDPVSLLDGFVLLYALEDAIVYRDPDDLLALKRIRAMVSLRNNSIFAHGLAPVAEMDYRKFSKFVQEIFAQFCELETIDFKKYEEQVRWISPLDSKYYQKG